MITSLTELLGRLGACDDAHDWAKFLPAGTTFEQAWYQCKRGDWMLWAVAVMDVDERLVVMAACGCARLALPYVTAGETRPLAAIETAEAWCRGEATVEQVKQASAAAYVAAAAARAAACAANAAAAHAAYASAYVAYASAAAYAAAYAAARAAARAAYAYDAAAYAVDAATAAAGTETLARCADIVRDYIPWAAVDAAIAAMEVR